MASELRLLPSKRYREAKEAVIRVIPHLYANRNCARNTVPVPCGTSDDSYHATILDLTPLDLTTRSVLDSSRIGGSR